MNIPIRIEKIKRTKGRIERWAILRPNNSVRIMCPDEALAQQELARCRSEGSRIAHLIEADDTAPKQKYKPIKPGDYYFGGSFLFRRDSSYNFSVRLRDGEITTLCPAIETDNIRLATVRFENGEIVATVEE